MIKVELFTQINQGRPKVEHYDATTLPMCGSLDRNSGRTLLGFHVVGHGVRRICVDDRVSVALTRFEPARGLRRGCLRRTPGPKQTAEDTRRQI